MSKDAEWKLKQGRGVFGVEAEGCAVEVEEGENEKKWNFSHRWDLVVAGTGGVFCVEPVGRSVQVEKVVHEED